MPPTARIQISLIHTPYKKLEVPKNVTVLEFDRYLFVVMNEEFTESKLRSVKNFLISSVQKTGAKQVKMSIELEAFPEGIRKINVKECQEGGKYIEDLLNRIRSELGKDKELQVCEHDVIIRTRTARGVLKMCNTSNTILLSVELEFDCVGRSVRGVLMGGLDVVAEKEVIEREFAKLVTHMFTVSSILASAKK